MFALLFAAMLAASNAVILRPVANMYSGPSEERDVVSQALYGANVELLEQQNGWARIRTADQYTGWVPVSALVLREKRYAEPGTRMAEVANLFAHIYREPSVTKRQPLLTVPFEARLEVAAEPEADSRRWIEVRLPDGGTAFVQRGDVAFSSPVLSVGEVAELSKRFLGLPYTWGGTSSFGYDCSGFTQMLCRRRGIPLPRDAQPQADWTGMRRVTTMEDLRPGDLLYFGKSDQKIVHTGFYLGDGEFIHATTSGRPVVQISRLADWTKTLVGMRRPKVE